MTGGNDMDIWLTAAECAQRIGLTVRALRLYEQHGLIAPRRTDKNWRRYGAGEIARLNEVLALKRLGLSLSRITTLLAGHETDLEHMLTMQQAGLLESRARVEHGLQMIAALQAKIAAGALVSVDELITLAKETNVTDDSSDVVAWRRYEQARPRTEIKIEPGVFDHYVGHYRFDSDAVLKVTEGPDGFFSQLTGQPPVQIFPESDHEFFLKVVPAQLSFVVGEQGAATAVVLHQGGYEQTAVRIEGAEAKDIEDALDKRINDKTPLPGSEALLRRIIAEHQRGEIDYDAMTEPMARACREQIAMIRTMLAEKGPLQSVIFKGVGPGGWDVYDVQFENGRLEWAFALASDGKISGIYLRPSL